MDARSRWKQVGALGLLIMAVSLLLGRDLFPDVHRHGHWFWIGVSGAVLWIVGQFAGRQSDR